MIKKVTDNINLSGVSSPLLPLIYCDFEYSSDEIDGVYFQYDDNNTVQAVFSLKGDFATLINVSGDSMAELSAFFAFLGVREVMSDRLFDSDAEVLHLMKLSPGGDSYSGAFFLNAASRTGEYRDVFRLLNEGEGDFSRWYSVFSKKINRSHALGAYMLGDDTVVSTATVTAIYGDSAVISGVFTHFSYRGKGYASACLKAVADELFKRGVSKVYLWCREDKVQFYEKLGFEVCGEIYQGRV